MKHHIAIPTFLSLALAVGLAACSQNGQSPSSGSTTAPANGHASAEASEETHEGQPAAPPLEAGQAEAIFAGGCFWCVETAFEGQPGVISVTSGYTGGHMDHPTYEQVGAHLTGHYEAVRVIYDPDETTYARLLDIFWHNIDPGQADGQFCDRGDSYRSAIFVADDEERRLATESKEEVARALDEDVATQILPASTFWVAEDYHQDFYRKNPTRYHSYREGCGRDRRLREIWGDSAGQPAH